MNDVHMSNGKQKITTNLKVKVWKKYFSDKVEGICCYCNRSILIPKQVKEVIFPDLDLDEHDNMISKPIYGTHFDHIVSEYNDGYTYIDNLRPICFECNLKKGNKNDEEFTVIVKTDNIDFMDIDVKENYCNGLRYKNGVSISCERKSYFRNKCINHLHQNTNY